MAQPKGLQRCPKGAGELRDGGDRGEAAARRVRGDVEAGGRGRPNWPSKMAIKLPIGELPREAES